MARAAVTQYKENGQPVSPQAIGYYETYQDALIALTEYNRNPYDLDGTRATFAEVHDAWLHEVEQVGKLSNSTLRAYGSAYKALAPLHQRVFSSLKLADLQLAIDSCPPSKAARELAAVVIKQLYKYAIKYDIVQKDYSHFIQIVNAVEDEKGVPFTEADIENMKAHADDENVKMVLLMIYSGFRISAYGTIKIEGEYFRGGVKTAASKNRIVPIHPLIKDYLYLLPEPAQAVRQRFAEAMKLLGITGHTPHDTRHTFSWLCDKYKVDSLSKKMMLGHSLGNDVTDARYGHRTPEELTEELLKVQ